MVRTSFIEVKKSDDITLDKENSKELLPSPLFLMVADTQMTELRWEKETNVNKCDRKFAAY